MEEWAQLMREDGESDDWQQEPQMRYDSGDEWDDRLCQEQYEEVGYEEWTWDRCTPLPFRQATSDFVCSKDAPSHAGSKLEQGPVAPQEQSDMLLQMSLCWQWGMQTVLSKLSRIKAQRPPQPDAMWCAWQLWLWPHAWRHAAFQG